MTFCSGRERVRGPENLCLQGTCRQDRLSLGPVYSARRPELVVDVKGQPAGKRTRRRRPRPRRTVGGGM